MHRTRILSAMGLLVAVSISPRPVPGQEAGATRALESPDFRVPIHTWPDDPELGAYGTWAAGRRYKVSFHDGPTFYPLLGVAAPDNLPVRWTTVGVRHSGIELRDAGEAPVRSHDAWRYEHRYRGFTERYDILPGGVEQSFVIHRPAAARGDLVVTGRWQSPLAPVRDAQPGSDVAAIRFRDGLGRDVVRYGEALAFDADGRRVDVATRLAGDRIELVVPAAWTEAATWPVTIDPLLTAETMALVGTASQAILHSDVAVASGAASHRVMTAFSLPASRADTDMHVLLTDENFQNPILVYSDVTTGWASNHPSVAYVDPAGPSGRWAVAFARATTTQSLIRVRLRDAADTTPGSGSTMFLPNTVFNRTDVKPDIGGSLSSNNALIVYENAGSFTTSEVYRVMLDADAQTFGTAALLAPTPIGGTILDRRNPSVGQVADGSPLRWMTCYQEYPSIPREWEIQARPIFDDGTAGLSARVAPDAPMTLGPEYVEPEVDGANTRFGVVYLVDENDFGPPQKIGMTRFMWPPSASLPSVSWSSTVDSTFGAGAMFDPRAVYDANAGHWAVAYRKRSLLTFQDTIVAARVGFDGAVVENQVVHAAAGDGAAPAIGYDFSNKRYVVTYGTEGAGSPVLGRLWTYPGGALNVPYGQSCGGMFGVLSDPLLGTEFFRVRLTGAAPSTAAVLLVGGGPATLPLDPIGMPNCTLRIDPTAVIALPATTDPAGDALVTIVGLTVAGDLHTQWLHVAPGANPLGLLATEGMRSQIR